MIKFVLKPSILAFELIQQLFSVIGIHSIGLKLIDLLHVLVLLLFQICVERLFFCDLFVGPLLVSRVVFSHEIDLRL